MKRLLSYLGSFLFIGSAVTTTVACDGDTSATHPDNTKDVIAKLKKSVIMIGGFSNTLDPSQVPTNLAIKKQLLRENPTLTESDLNQMTFNKTNLIPDGITEVPVTLTVSDDWNHKSHITIQIQHKNIAEELKSEIKLTDLILPTTTDPDISTLATQSALWTALKTSNSNIASQKTATQSFSFAPQTPNTKLKFDTNTTVVLTISVAYGEGGSKTETATINLNVKLRKLSNEIKHKIKYVNLRIDSSTDPDTSEPATIATIKTTLKTDNSTLTEDDLKKISFAETTLVFNQQTAVVATVTGTQASDTATITLNILLESLANQIKAKIQHSTLFLPVNTPIATSDPQTTKALKDGLKQLNKDLTDDDLSKISFTNTSLTLGSEVNVTTNITGTQASDTAAITLKVTIIKETATDLLKLIHQTNITVPVGTNPSTVLADTIRVLRTALRSANPALTTGDLEHFSFNQTHLRTDDTAPVNLIVNINSTHGLKLIHVTLPISSQGIIDKIHNKTILLDATTPVSTTNSQTITNIKTALKNKNSSLTTADIGQLSFAQKSLVPRQVVDVLVTASVPAVPAVSTTLKIKLDTSAQKIIDKIINTQIVLPLHTDPSTTNLKTIKTLKFNLQKSNPTLTDDDLNQLIFSNVALNSTFQSVTVTANYNSQQGTKTITVSITDPPNIIKQKITDLNLTLPNTTNYRTWVASTVTKLKTVLKNDNATLTQGDLNHITFDVKNLTYQTAAQPLNLYITVGTVTATVQLNVILDLNIKRWNTHFYRHQIFKIDTTDANLNNIFLWNDDGTGRIEVGTLKSNSDTSGSPYIWNWLNLKSGTVAGFGAVAKKSNGVTRFIYGASNSGDIHTGDTSDVTSVAVNWKTVDMDSQGFAFSNMGTNPVFADDTDLVFLGMKGPRFTSDFYLGARDYLGNYTIYEQGSPTAGTQDTKAITANNDGSRVIVYYRYHDVGVTVWTYHFCFGVRSIPSPGTGTYSDSVILKPSFMSTSINSMAMNNDGSKIFLGTDTGLVIGARTSGNNYNWTTYNDTAIGGTIVNSVKIANNGNTIFVTTNSGIAIGGFNGGSSSPAVYNFVINPHFNSWGNVVDGVFSVNSANDPGFGTIAETGSGLYNGVFW